MLPRMNSEPKKLRSRRDLVFYRIRRVNEFPNKPKIELSRTQREMPEEDKQRYHNTKSHTVIFINMFSLPHNNNLVVRKGLFTES